MGKVTGPISTLPGTIHPLPPGTMCDVHADRVAVKRIQGETDSFGSELNDCCQECVDEIKNAEPVKGQCDWCDTKNVEVQNKRDYEEGMSGRVYQICKPCNNRYEARMAREAQEEDDRRNYYDPYESRSWIR